MKKTQTTKGATLVVCLPLLLFFFSNAISAQADLVSRQDTAQYPYWFEMMQDPDANFYATQSAFYKYWENREINVKGNGYKIFKRWEYINRNRLLTNGNRISPGYVAKTYNEYLRNNVSTRSLTGNWTIEGPTSYPNNEAPQPTGMGRVNAIAFHPTNTDIIYVGAPSGGFWRSTDGGASWVSLSSNLPTLGVSSILIHPTNPNIIYIGTGDRDSDDAPGLGVFKSTSGGLSWTQINATMGDATVGAMAMSPSNPDVILAATSKGLYKTTNGGTSWSLKLTSSLWKDVKFKPGDSSIAYAAFGGLLYRSTNGGDNWSNTSIPISGGRIVIGVSAANPNYVYLAQTTTSNTFAGLMLSTDSGLTFTTQSTTPNIYSYECDGSGTSGQARYDLCIAVDPLDEDIVYLGSINIWKSTNGGVNWNIQSHWVGSDYADPCNGVASVHADQHVLAWNDTSGKLYTGHDGGVSWTNDGGNTWTEISDGLAIAQIYKIGQSASSSGTTLNGYQDNGSAKHESGVFTTVFGGDGMECVADDNAFYIASPYGRIRRSLGGSYSTIAGENYNGITERGSWVTPYLMHHGNSSIMFAGYDNVWRTNNAQASSSSSVSWSAISTGESSDCQVLEQSPANEDILYVARSGSLKRTDNANDSPNDVIWTSCALPGGSTPSDIEAHHTNPNILFATAGLGVYKSINKGVSWTEITGTLPAIPINCLAIDPNVGEGLYIGNQAGVWYKDPSLSNWIHFSNGLPVVDIRELEIFTASDAAYSVIKAATYGRGLWASDLYVTTTILPISLASFSANCDKHTVSLKWATEAEINNDFFTIERSADGLLWLPLRTVDGAGQSYQLSRYNITDEAPLSNISYYRLKQTDFDGTYTYSDKVSVNCGQANLQDLSIWPNPTTGKLTISGYGDSAKLKIYHPNGVMLYQTELFNNINEIQINDLPTGIYSLVISSDQKVIVHKLIKE